MPAPTPQTVEAYGGGPVASRAYIDGMTMRRKYGVWPNPHNPELEPVAHDYWGRGYSYAKSEELETEQSDYDLACEKADNDRMDRAERVRG